MLLFLYENHMFLTPSTLVQLLQMQNKSHQLGSPAAPPGSPGLIPAPRGSPRLPAAPPRLPRAVSPRLLSPQLPAALRGFPRLSATPRGSQRLTVLSQLPAAHPGSPKFHRPRLYLGSPRSSRGFPGLPRALPGFFPGSFKLHMSSVGHFKYKVQHPRLR